MYYPHTQLTKSQALRTHAEEYYCTGKQMQAEKNPKDAIFSFAEAISTLECIAPKHRQDNDYRNIVKCFEKTVNIGTDDEIISYCLKQIIATINNIKEKTPRDIYQSKWALKQMTMLDNRSPSPKTATLNATIQNYEPSKNQPQ